MIKNRAKSEAKPSKTIKGAADSKSPLYMQVAQELKAEIVNGVYPVGSLIPTEDEMCKRFSISQARRRVLRRRHPRCA